MKSQQGNTYYILSQELVKNCEKDEVCTINIFIQLDASLRKFKNRLETTITQVNGAPIYLGKNIIRKDFLVGDHPKYFYLDIGREEMGNISINYKNNSGNIYASIVKKIELKEDKEATWRGIYIFQKSIEESFHYDTYLKKIFISHENTKQCTQGCYVLITVQSSNARDVNYTDEKNSSIPYIITITPIIIQRNLIPGQHINTTQSNSSPAKGKLDIKLIIIIVGSCVFGIIIIILIIMVCVFYNRNKNLMKNVAGISFADDDRNNNLLTGEIKK